MEKMTAAIRASQKLQQKPKRKTRLWSAKNVSDLIARYLRKVPQLQSVQELTPWQVLRATDLVQWLAEKLQWTPKPHKRRLQLNLQETTTLKESTLQSSLTRSSNISLTTLSKLRRDSDKEVTLTERGLTLNCTTRKELVLSRRRTRWRTDSHMPQALSILQLSTQSSSDFTLENCFV